MTCWTVSITRGIHPSNYMLNDFLFEFTISPSHHLTITMLLLRWTPPAKQTLYHTPYIDFQLHLFQNHSNLDVEQHISPHSWYTTMIYTTIEHIGLSCDLLSKRILDWSVICSAVSTDPERFHNQRWIPHVGSTPRHNERGPLSHIYLCNRASTHTHTHTHWHIQCQDLSIPTQPLGYPSGESVTQWFQSFDEQNVMSYENMTFCEFSTGAF